MMFQFLFTKVEKRLLAIKEYVYCLWQFYILYQFIPLVHQPLFLRMYNSDDYLAQNMNFVGLMDRNPICSIFMGFKNSVLVFHRIQFMIPNVREFFNVMKV